VPELRAGRKQNHWMWFIFSTDSGARASFDGLPGFADFFTCGRADVYCRHEILGPNSASYPLVKFGRGALRDEIFG